MSKYVNQEIDPDHVWINISKGKIVYAAVLTTCSNICRGVYKLEAVTISTVKEMVIHAKVGDNIINMIVDNIRFYILEEVKEDNNDVTG